MIECPKPVRAERRDDTLARVVADYIRYCRPRARIVIEASTGSEWVARCLEALGHEIIVADPNFAPMYATRTALQRSLDGFMHGYNHERPHQGYRVRGRTPAALFWGAVSA